MPQVVRHTTKKEKETGINYQFSPDLYVPRQLYEQLADRVQAIESKLTVTVYEKPEKLLFPDEVLERLPHVVKKTIKGIMLNYEHDFPEFCFMGMRKALIDAILIRFQKDRKQAMLYDENGNAYKLSTWIENARHERYISKNIAKGLKSFVKVFGDVASHDYKAALQKEEVPPVFVCLRMALSGMYYDK